MNTTLYFEPNEFLSFQKGEPAKAYNREPTAGAGVGRAVEVSMGVDEVESMRVLSDVENGARTGNAYGPTVEVIRKST